MRAGDWLITSGQIGLHEGKLVMGGVVDELRQALANMKALIESEGATIEHITKTTVFMRHMRDFDLVNHEYVAFFGDHRPARSPPVPGS